MTKTTAVVLSLIFITNPFIGMMLILCNLKTLTDTNG
jgi:hypothetical protein